MLTKGFLKPEISIDKLGKRQFWTGTIIGVLIAFILSYFFNYSRESLRMITFMADPYILTEKEFRLYDLFFASFATSLGFGFTIIYWLRGRNKNIKKRYLKTFTISNAWLVTFVALMLVARFGSILPIIVYGLHGYDGQLDLLHDFWLMFVLIPIYVFFAHWNTIRMIFRTRYWVLLSIVFYILTTFYLYKTTYADRNILNQSYYSQNKQRFDYIDSEFENARKLGVFFSDTTKQILRKKYAERTTDLVLNLKQAFQSDKIVPIDTLILEKIVIHNMNRHGLYFYGRHQDKDRNWPYPVPENIYKQILKHDIDSKETELLFEILSEQISLFTAPRINWDEWDKYTDFEREKSNFRKNLMYSTETIQSRLIQVVDKLKSDKQFERFHHFLNDIEFNNDRGRQKHYLTDEKIYLD
ncbi:MAG TPA: hypothetical protein VE912_00855 [Bacteroidales bacterium]|nr:hypothetical protein [Bacteroidales bacterium]